MINKNEQILGQMDETLDQLIINAKTLHAVSPHKLEAHELEALQKTQESLLAHLMHLDKVLTEKMIPKKPLQEKALQFQGLNQHLQKRFHFHRRRKSGQKSR